MATDDEMCCEPDYDYEVGQYVHEKGCWGSVEANRDRDAEREPDPTRLRVELDRQTQTEPKNLVEALDDHYDEMLKIESSLWESATQRQIYLSAVTETINEVAKFTGIPRRERRIVSAIKSGPSPTDWDPEKHRLGEITSIDRMPTPTWPGPIDTERSSKRRATSRQGRRVTAKRLLETGQIDDICEAVRNHLNLATEVKIIVANEWLDTPGTYSIEMTMPRLATAYEVSLDIALAGIAQERTKADGFRGIIAEARTWVEGYFQGPGKHGGDDLREILDSVDK